MLGSHRSEPTSEYVAHLEAQLARATQMIEALVDRVENATDFPADDSDPNWNNDAFSVFETSVAWDFKVQARTAGYERTLNELEKALIELGTAKEAADGAQRRLQDAIESINEGFAIFDADDRLVLCNQTYLSLWPSIADRIVPGISYADLVMMIGEAGTSLEQKVAPRRWVSERLGQRLGVASSPHVHALSDGRWIQMDELRTSEGGIVVVCTDITQVRQRSADLEAVNNQLQREIRERVAAEAALLEAKVIAEQLNLDKTRFLAAASHDLLQPLNAARLFVTALSKRRIASTSRSLVVQAGSALDSVEEILEALLEISQLDAGAIQPVKTDLDLDALLQSMQTAFAPFAKQRGLKLEIGPVKHWVRTDGRLLRRILQNLVSNALHYTERGEVRVTARRVKDQVVIGVRDTGPGIPRKYRETIFKEFSRLNGASHTRGLGLGLAIVERAARMLAHPLSLRSKVGTGSTFSISVPLGQMQTSRDKMGARNIKNNLSGCAALVIDNDVGNLAAMAALLGEWGCHAETATDEKSAWSALDRLGGAPNVIIADYHLDRGLLGDELIGRLSKSIRKPAQSIIVTADRDQMLGDQLARKGLHMLTKPVHPAKLRALLQHMITSHRARM